ncbi:uncharacterized protein BO97DRAFT_462254 [Aspergillus homomorphus CBS 101889]|uniref:Rhodopsin domain-containing protein n=1 Tax=Aspergillus homomorphus (strain CBS 101889) TaxID=1450537 RepID=A0A395HJJ8_ASPHC|nr:hypothetical protein BO97DRAFT_462254 [Aspergillus homomorphus CBS 101889]RAL07950.1 hypothetical protein BO97DRAFT_462254 [Aspergillus homomorphus CBS 101889]
MAEDPAIRALFGPAPATVNLNASAVAVNNGAVIAMLSLAAVAVMLRFIARLVLRNALMADDWAIIAALICIGATTGLSIAGGATGAGRHIWSVTLEELMHLYRVSSRLPSQPALLFSYTFIYAASCTCTRLSILFFYWRVFSPLKPFLRVALIFGAFLTLSYPIIVWVTMSNSCKPVTYFWTQFSGTSGQCIDVDRFFLAAGILNMLNDFIILIIPFPRIVKLQMSVQKKVAISGIMAVGIFVCIASIVRIRYLSIFMSSVDLTWLMGPVFIWSSIEPSVAVVCACMPHLAPLARLAHRSISSSFHSRRSATESSGKPRRHRRESRQGVQKGHRSSHWGPTFDFGFEQLKKTANDDEIGLTNFVTAGPIIGKDSSIESVLEAYARDHEIAVQSSFVQSSSQKHAL